MTGFCYEFISGCGSAKIIKNRLRFAKVIDRSCHVFMAHSVYWKCVNKLRLS